MPNKLYVWEEVLCDWSCGLVCVVARDEQEALSLLKAADEVAWEECSKIKPIEHSFTEPGVFWVYGNC